MAKKSDNYYFENFIQCVECGCQAAMMLEENLANFDVNRLSENLDELHKIEHLSLIHILAPQGVCYALAWAVLAMWAGKQEKKIRLAPFGLLLLVGALGTFLEVYASPALYGLWF